MAKELNFDKKLLYSGIFLVGVGAIEGYRDISLATSVTELVVDFSVSSLGVAVMFLSQRRNSGRETQQFVSPRAPVPYKVIIPQDWDSFEVGQGVEILIPPKDPQNTIS